MRTSKNNILIIVLIVIAVIAVIGGVFAYLFLATDVFKSGQELFAKYLMQNMEDLKEVSNIEKISELKSELEQNKYEENVVISCSETSNEDANIKLTIDTQKDSVSGKIYSILGLSLPNQEEKIKLEYMQEDDMYSLRFTNAVKQFLTVQNSELKQFAQNLGVDEEEIEVIPDTIDFEKFSFKELEFTEEETNTEVNKYTSLLYKNIAKEKYQKNKDVVITVNGKTITTNSYVLTLSNQEVKTLLIKILEALKQDEIILGKLQKLDEKLEKYEIDSIKDSFVQSIQEEIDYLNEEEITEESNFIFTVYEANKETVRIKVEKDLEYITLDTTKQEENTQVDINYTSVDEENTQFSNKICLVKENNNLNMTFNTVDGEEQHSTNVEVEVTESENNTKIDVLLETEIAQINISRDIKIVNDVEYKVTLENSNNIILNNLSSAQLSSIFTQLGERLNTEYVEPLETVITPIMALILLDSGNGVIIDNAEVTDEELNTFNSRFEIYEGKNISTEEVNVILNSVYNNNEQEIFSIEDVHYIRVSGVLTLEENATEVPELEGDNFYNIRCIYGQNRFINEIIITQVDEQNEIIENN